MQLTDQQIEEFRTLYFKRFNKEISREDAVEQAMKLLRLVMIIYKPMAVEDYDAIQKRRLETLPETLRYIVECMDDE